jgi:hypothetical protein
MFILVLPIMYKLILSIYFIKLLINKIFNRFSQTILKWLLIINMLFYL